MKNLFSFTRTGVLATYSPEEVKFLLGGFFEVEAFESIRISKVDSRFTSYNTADGDTIRVQNRKEDYRVTLSLTSTSNTNSMLTKVASMDKHFGVVTFPIMVRDKSGDSLFVSQTAWIEEEPDVIYSDKVEEKEWVFYCTECTNVIGGNSYKSDINKDLFNFIVG